MPAGRALLPLGLCAVYALIHGAPDRVPLDFDDRLPPVPAIAPTPALLAADPPSSLDELQRRLARVMERENISGLGIGLIGKAGPLWIGGLGVRDRETRAPVDGDTVFRVGSLSKSIIALGVMRLVDQGKLDVDAPLRELLPGVIENPWEETSPITLAQCLEHTTGIDDVRFSEVYGDERISVADTLALNPRSRIARWRPGTRHAYSNIGYTVAARAIEVVTGEPFDVWIRREILAPLGITDADFHRTPLLRERLAIGYDGDRPTTFHAFAHRPSGGLLASTRDLAKLVHFWIRRGEGYPPIVSRAGLARIERSGTLPYGSLAAEYGFANYGDVHHPVLGRGHDGGMPGFQASIRYFPELEAGYVMTINANYTFRGYGEIRALLFAYLTAGREFPPPPQPVPHDARPGADYFAFAAPRHALFAFIDQAVEGWHTRTEGDAVQFASLDGTWTTVLYPTHDAAYRVRGEYGSAIRFTTNSDGTPVIAFGFTYGEAENGWLAQLQYWLLGLVMMLFRFAPLWAAYTLAVGLVRRRRTLPLSLILWPAVAGLACFAIMPLLFQAFEAGVVGDVHPLTIGVFVSSLLLAVGSTATLIAALRWWVRPDRPRWVSRIVPTVSGIAFFGFTLWAAVNGLIGLRTWAY